MDELITIITPVYNGAAYIAKCINCMLNQTYSNIEIIIVDDGSTDDTSSIVDVFVQKHPDRVKYIYQENKGPLAARITGICASYGTWIGFMDADDEIEPDMYERLLLNAVRYGADVSHCGHQTIVNNGERIHYFYNTGRLTVQDGQSALKDLLNGGFEPSLWTKLFNRRLFAEVMEEEDIRRTIKYNEDLLLNYYLFSKAEKTVFEDFCGYHYIARLNSATRSSFRIEKVMDPVLVNGIILDHVGPDFKSIAWSNYLRCCLNAYMSLWNRSEFREQASELRVILKKNKNKYQLLSRNEQLKLNGMLSFPTVFTRVYGVYRKRFQKKRYE